MSEGVLYQNAGSVGEEGGRCLLYSSENESGPWAKIGDEEFSDPKDWGALDLYYGYWLSASEVGDGTHYAGESEKSEPYYAEEP